MVRWISMSSAVRIGDAFEGDAAGAHDGDIGVHFRKCLDRQRPH